MKNIYILLIFITTLLNAQNKNTKSADKLYDRYEFVDAAKAYLKLVEKNKADGYVYKQLADSYYNVFNATEAIKWYAKAIATKQSSETYFRYSQMLKANGNYLEANKQMQEFARLNPQDYRAVQFLNNPNYLEQLNSLDALFDIKKIDINSDKSDFGAFLADNTLYFASARSKSGKKFAWNNEPYLDIYSSTYNPDGTFSVPTIIEELNSKYNDGPLALSPDGNMIYFASESFRDKMFVKNKEKKTKYGQISLFSAKKMGGKWENIVALPFSSKEYSTCNPSVSKDGKTLYFSSNMPGSLGNTDIWKVAINDDGSYGKPENLGAKINTEGRESFPFIDDTNKLYFSSDSHPGFGGYDIFVVDLNKPEEVKNIAKPVNSEKDDFSFSYNKSKKIGFFSSNRTGQDDIVVLNEIIKLNLKTIIKDAKTNQYIPEATVVIIQNNAPFLEKNSNFEGKTEFVLSPENEYSIKVTKSGYNDYTMPIEKSDKTDLEIKIALIPIEPVITEKEIILQNIYFEFDKSNITQLGANELDKLILIMIENPTMEIDIISHTDNDGSEEYNLSLSERRAKSSAQYLISKGIETNRITYKGQGEIHPIIICNPCTETENATNRRSEFIILKK
jgi:outer membrane protein OmpA-like peptidoglycan-associated protein/tetratricopeptide (TPR) repeat protein